MDTGCFKEIMEMISAEEAIIRLKEGNAQYVSTNTFKADISSALLEHFAKNGQLVRGG